MKEHVQGGEVAKLLAAAERHNDVAGQLGKRSPENEAGKCNLLIVPGKSGNYLQGGEVAEVLAAAERHDDDAAGGAARRHLFLALL